MRYRPLAFSSYALLVCLKIVCALNHLFGGSRYICMSDKNICVSVPDGAGPDPRVKARLSEGTSSQAELSRKRKKHQRSDKNRKERKKAAWCEKVTKILVGEEPQPQPRSKPPPFKFVKKD
jgi:hypothetical protein